MNLSTSLCSPNGIKLCLAGQPRASSPSRHTMILGAMQAVPSRLGGAQLFSKHTISPIPLLWTVLSSPQVESGWQAMHRIK
jgi:hypothetical protein